MTSPFGDALLQAIREQVARNMPRTTAMGTVQSVRSDAYRAMVVMDGSSVAMPVKVVGNVNPAVGNRVILALHGSDWVIDGAFSTGGLGYGSINASAAAGSTSSGTYAAIPSGATFTFTKRWDFTLLRLDLLTSAFAGAAFSRVQFAIQIAGTSYPMAKQWFNAAIVRQTIGGFDTVGPIPAGPYAASVVWRLDTGPGPINQQVDDDWVSASATEIVNG